VTGTVGLAHGILFLISLLSILPLSLQLGSKCN
jgi:tetrahydromethanopterin S-methyltransferase subunit F